MSFGSNIGYLRKKKGITQEELAERMYVSRQTISRWETDSVYPDVETVIRLCEILECDMETLVRGDASAEKESAPVQEQEPEQKEKTEIKMELRRSTVLKVVTDMLFPIATLAYLVMGFVWDLWHPGWLIFVAAAVLSPLLSAINRPKLRPIKKGSHFGPVIDWDELNAGICALSFIIAIAAYLFMGFAYSLWHPGWWVFIAATVLCAVSSIICTQILPALFGERERIDDEDDE